MASMSYCVIENTSFDMCQSVRKFKYRINDILDNPYEKASLSSLYEEAKEFVELYEEYMDDKEAYIEEHSNSDED